MRRTIRERNILFLCENNASLSQKAEAVAKHLDPPKVKIFSAGIKPTMIPSQVHKVMDELGVSLEGQSSKKMNDVPLNEIDLVISFEGADKKCSPLPKKIKIENWSIPAPASSNLNSPATLTKYRHERDEINKRVFALFMDYWRNDA
jgi:protein-tyrosine-phosphatase